MTQNSIEKAVIYTYKHLFINRLLNSHLKNNYHSRVNYDGLHNEDEKYIA